MIPASERLDAFDDPAIRRNARRLRLVVNLNLPSIERRGQRRRRDRRVGAQALAQRRFEIRQENRFLQRAQHLQPLRTSDLLRRREDALIHAACDQHVRLAAALAEIAEQLDAIGARHLQIQHDDGRLKLLYCPTKRIGLGHRTRFEPEAGGGFGNELAQVGLIVDHQQLVLAQATRASRSSTYRMRVARSSFR